ncbi:CopG family transcriptional regulator [bacterium]|nr:CopG family transcriptional regulator [bacterium]
MKKSKKTSKAKNIVQKQGDSLDHDMSDFIQGASGWKRIRFEFMPKNKTVTIRMSEELLTALKKKAQASGIDYQKFIRLKLEQIIDDDAA